MPGLEARVPEPFAAVCARYPEIYAIVSPPRCSSTAFARVFWEQPSIRYYCHEPFEVTYYMQQDLREVVRKLESPLDLDRLKQCQGRADAGALVIKEMPYQVGERLPLLAAVARKPIVFLMRDPRSSIASRMRKKTQVGDAPVFPEVESGWELLAAQVEWCRAHHVPYLLVDSSDFRNDPEAVFSQVFDRFGLPFDADMLRWRPCPDVELDNLAGRHRHLYLKVLASTGIEPDRTPIPPLEHFPETDGWRDHVVRCLEIYEALSASEERVVTGVTLRSDS